MLWRKIVSLFQPRSHEDEWQRIIEIADKLKTPYAHRLFVVSGYSVHDCRIDLLATVPTWVRRRRKT